MPDGSLHAGLDARCFTCDHQRDTAKSMYELIGRTASSGAVTWHLFADRPGVGMPLPAEASIAVSIFDARQRDLHAWEQWDLPLKARRQGVDVLHSPATSMPWWQPVPSVVTIHDAVEWQGAGAAWPAGFFRDRLLPAAYRRAAAIMTVSESARRDILARWPALKPKLHVVSPGVDERYLESAPDTRPLVIDDRVLSGRYLLYVGGADPRRRLSWALQTWAGVAASGASLVVCGVERDGHAEVRRMVPRELQDRLIIAPVIGDDDMPRLYMRAAAVLYPSLYDGFGLPVVEAHAVGTPILCSDAGALSDLKGPGAVALPVDDLSAWVRAAADMLRSRNGVSGPDRIAREWARQYSWDAYIERTLAVYDSVRVRRPKVPSRGQRVSGVQEKAR